MFQVNIYKEKLLVNPDKESLTIQLLSLVYVCCLDWFLREKPDLSQEIN